MKYLLLLAGLTSYIAGLFLLFKGHKKKSLWFILIGGLLIIANCFYLWYRINNEIEIAGIVVVSTFIFLFVIGTILHYTEESEKESVFFSFVILSLILFITFGGKLPSVTLENDVIKMGGSFGRSFNISSIQSIDTVNVYPRVGIRRKGAGFPASSIGNFALENERMTAKLCLYLGVRYSNNNIFQ